ncbi:4-oxalocrotonate decarboxylase [Gordonia sp. PDNC005]|uniref:2-keto-4-pentenoate hydratase n=1 Tax=unclassified Gordonia (in: high G+C Gram-positive bacteria) TaxID=2657482 RepID=UPI0019658480|nr:4-oxalocrotonate decarboxylase [Gordonia sp. PDNC005]QRY64662.1 4-oxalocrotonate decarboxylase [Gordonia sp. PDNC005]
MNDQVAALAERLDDAQTRRIETTSIEADRELSPDFDVALAYRVQDELIARREARGEKVIGVKLGFTSKAKMAQMGVSDVIVGRLTDAMKITDGGVVDLGRFIHPKVEPEVAYRISCDVDLDDPDVDMLEHVDAIAAAVEVIDSRYLDFVFTYADVVADNTSASGFALGEWVPLREAADCAVTMTVGDEVTSGSTAAILDDPANALTALLDMCRRHRIPLRAGQIVLAGAATAATALTATSVSCVVDGVGSVGFTAHASEVTA